MNRLASSPIHILSNYIVETTALFAGYVFSWSHFPSTHQLCHQVLRILLQKVCLYKRYKTLRMRQDYLFCMKHMSKPKAWMNINGRNADHSQWISLLSRFESPCGQKRAWKEQVVIIEHHYSKPGSPLYSSKKKQMFLFACASFGIEADQKNQLPQKRILI